MKKFACTLCVLLLLTLCAGALATTAATWSDYVVTLNGVDYTLPCNVSVLTQNGWTLDEDDASIVLEPNQYSSFRLHNGEAVVYASIINVGINDMPIADCLLGGLELDDYDAEKGATLSIAGITLGQSSDDVTTAWGAPTDASDTRLEYETDRYESITVRFDEETKLITSIDVRKFSTPDGYNDEAYAAPVEVPESVTAYVAPTELGDDPLAFTFRLNGVVYGLPVPVSVFAENGWTLNGEEYAPKLAAHETDFGWKLQNGAQSLESVGVRNDSPTANTWQNGMVVQFRASGYKPVDIELPCGITLSSTPEELEAALEGKTYEKNESGSFVYYRMEIDWSNYVEITVDTDEGTITGIELERWGD